MPLLAFVNTQIDDFKQLNTSEKVCLVSSWLANIGASFLFGSAVLTSVSWINGNEPSAQVKQALIFGLGATLTGSLLSSALAQEEERTFEQQLNFDLDEIENFRLLTKEQEEQAEAGIKSEEDIIWNKITQYRLERDNTPCPNCQFFNVFSDYQGVKCAVHPDIACTPKALDCPDFTSRDEED